MSELKMSRELQAALKVIAHLLNEGRHEDYTWLLGGSTGLLLHGVLLDKTPGDIDLYADLDAAELIQGALSAYALGDPVEDYSNNCYSLRSHYRIEGFKVELACGFRIYSGLSRYAVETSRLKTYGSVQDVKGIGCLRLMPLAHEFAMNVLRGRRERYKAIAAVMEKDIPGYLPLLQELFRRHQWGPSHVPDLGRVLDIRAAGM